MQSLINVYTHFVKSVRVIPVSAVLNLGYRIMGMFFYTLEHGPNSRAAHPSPTAVYAVQTHMYPGITQLVLKKKCDFARRGAAANLYVVNSYSFVCSMVNCIFQNTDVPSLLQANVRELQESQVGSPPRPPQVAPAASARRARRIALSSARVGRYREV